MRESAKKALARLPSATIRAVVEPFIFGDSRTTVWIRPVTEYEVGHHNEGLNWVPTMQWYYTGEKYTGVIDEPMPRDYEKGDVAAVTLYKIGHTEDSSRDPLFTTKKEKALAYLAAP